MSIQIDASKGIKQNTTEVTKIPVGTTAQRPANPAAGMIRFNTDEGFVEGYDPLVDDWLNISDIGPVAATGGTVTDITQDGEVFRVHTFTSSGTFDVTRGGDVECLVVAGGGGGGGDGNVTGARTNGGGGGAGGLIFKDDLSLGISSNSVTVGNGGSGERSRGSTGQNSSVFGLISLGGGGGGAASGSGGSGGSGGGGGGTGGLGSGSGGSGLQPTSASGGFGNNGGSGTQDSTRASGGGGGAGSAGIDQGQGGDGLFFGDKFGANLGEDGRFAGGGWRFGGDKDFPAGGGRSAPAIPSTGGGGGGNGGFGVDGFAGGSGIVIVRYRIG